MVITISSHWRLASFHALVSGFSGEFVLCLAGHFGEPLATFLSLLGVMVGIFVISAVFAVVDSLEEELKDTFSMIDDDVLFINKWPWEFGEDYPWWKYVQRRVPTERDLELLMPRLTLAQAGPLKTMLDAEAGNNGMPGVVVVAASQDYPGRHQLDIAKGRFFTAPESNAGRAVAVVGHGWRCSCWKNRLFGPNPQGPGHQVGSGGGVCRARPKPGLKWF